jgi:alpha-mannosidase
VFDLAVGLDRGFPAQTALGLVTPAPVVATSQGPPHVGDSGWLFHLDASNLLLTSLRPAADGADAVVARLVECTGRGGAAELRCARDPHRAAAVDLPGNRLMELGMEGDAVFLDAGRHDLLQVRVDFS